MKKLVALALAMLMTLTAVSGLSAVFAAEGDNAVTATGATHEYDFGKYLPDTYSTFGITDRKNVAGMRTATGGYVTIRADKNPSATTPCPYFSIGKLPTADASLVDVVLIKYNISLDVACKGKMNVTLSNGENKSVEWTYACDGKWNFAVIDASEVWGNTPAGTTITALQLCPLESEQLKKGDDIQIQYIKMFADVVSAEAAVKADGVYTGSMGVLPADEVFYDEENDRYYSADPLIQLSAEAIGGVYAFGANTTFLMVGETLYTPSEDGTTLQVKEGMYITQNDSGAHVLINGTKETPVTFVDTLYSGVDGNLYTQGNGAPVAQYPGLYNRVTAAADVTVPALGTDYEAAPVVGADVQIYSVHGEKEDGIIFEVGESLTEIVAAGWIGLDGKTAQSFGFVIDDNAPMFDSAYVLSAEAAVKADEVGGANAVRCQIPAFVGRLADGVHTVRFVVKTTGGDIYEIPGTRTVVVTGSAVEKEFAGYGAVGYPTTYSFWTSADERNFVRGGEFDVVANGDDTFSYDNREYVGKTPSAPLNPGDEIAPEALINGAMLNGIALNDLEIGSYDREEGYMTLTANGSNPYYTLFNEQLAVKRYLAIRYRTTAANCYGEIYAGSFGNEAMGVVDGGRIEYVADGEWHTAIVDLSVLSGAYDTRTDVINYLRHDVLAADEGGAGVEAGASIDIAYYGFFATQQEAESYEYLETPTVYFVNFLNEDGSVYKAVAYAPGATTVMVPEVPAKDGYTGEWDEYTLADADISVNPVYTELPSEETTTEAVEETTTEEVEETTAPVVDTTAPTEDTTAGEQTAGCKSVVGSIAALATVAMGAVVVLARRTGREE